MVDFLRGLFLDSMRGNANSEEQRTRHPDYEVFDRAQAIKANLHDLLDDADLFTTQTAFIFRIQQDIYEILGVNVADPEPFTETRQGIDVLQKAFQAIEEVAKRKRVFWKQQHSEGDTAGALLGSLMTTACEFWITHLFAPASDFTPLSLCVMHNHLLIASTNKDRMMNLADAHPNLFFPAGDYELRGSHWPYIDIDRVMEEYQDMTKDGPLLEQLLGRLPDQRP
jgi:hypothetical protein